jgi:phage antirepressor YoqD-like protein
MKLKKIIPVAVVLIIVLILIKRKEKMTPKVNQLDNELVDIKESPEKTSEKIIFVNKNPRKLETIYE